MRPQFREQTAVGTYCRRELENQLRDARRIASDVDAPMLTRPRPGGKWSIAAIFDHMAIMNRLYLQKLEPALDAAPHSARRDWSPTLFGRFLRRGVNTRMKLPTLPLFNPPDPASEPGAIERFVSSHLEMSSLLDRSGDVHWRTISVSSPAADFVKLNLGDAFLILTEHTNRHMAQIAEATHA